MVGADLSVDLGGLGDGVSKLFLNKANIGSCLCFMWGKRADVDGTAIRSYFHFLPQIVLKLASPSINSARCYDSDFPFCYRMNGVTFFARCSEICYKAVFKRIEAFNKCL